MPGHASRGGRIGWTVQTVEGEKLMSFGAKNNEFKTKRALTDAVKERGAENVFVFDTSGFANKGTVSVASLVDTTAVIVGPDVYNKRDWYANVKRDSKGNIVIK